MAGGPVLVVGAGGHARVCIEVLRDAGVEVAGCVSADGTASADVGVPVLGRDADLADLVAGGLDRLLPAIGDNRVRLAVLDRCRGLGATLVNAVSPHAVLARSVRLGVGVAVMPGVVVNGGTVIGDGVVLNTNSSVDHDCRVGRTVHVAPGSAVAGGVTLEEGVLLGIGSCVVPGCTIGAWTIVGAGGAVVADLPPGVTAVGVPARSRPGRGGG